MGVCIVILVCYYTRMLNKLAYYIVISRVLISDKVNYLN